MILNCYSFFTIDHHWNQLQPINEFFHKIVDDPRNQLDSYHKKSYMLLDEAVATWKYAQILAKENGWEGDFRQDEGPHVFWLPNKENLAFEYAFIFKQNNNGTTFIISSMDIAWLEKDEDVTTVWKNFEDSDY